MKETTTYRKYEVYVKDDRPIIWSDINEALSKHFEDYESEDIFVASDRELVELTEEEVWDEQ